MGTQTLAQRSLLLFTQTDKVHQKNCISISYNRGKCINSGQTKPKFRIFHAMLEKSTQLSVLAVLIINSHGICVTDTFVARFF